MSSAKTAVEFYYFCKREELIFAVPLSSLRIEFMSQARSVRRRVTVARSTLILLCKVFNCGGRVSKKRAILDEAESNTGARLVLDSDNPRALYGLGSVAACEKIGFLRGSFYSTPWIWRLHLTAARLLGDVLLRSADKPGALRSYEAYIALLRAGSRCRSTPISTRDDVEDVLRSMCVCAWQNCIENWATCRVRKRDALAQRKDGSAKSH